MSDQKPQFESVALDPTKTGMQSRPDIPPLPDFRTQPTPEAVVIEHYEGLNTSNWERLVAQATDDFEVLLTGGTRVSGRAAGAELFHDFCKPWEEGGFRGLKFDVDFTKVVGNSVFVRWDADAYFLAEPYGGADIYVVRDGLLAGFVGTFNPPGLVTKEQS